MGRKYLRENDGSKFSVYGLVFEAFFEHTYVKVKPEEIPQPDPVSKTTIWTGFLLDDKGEHWKRNPELEYANMELNYFFCFWDDGQNPKDALYEFFDEVWDGEE